ncbi:MAG: quinone oxidoreductase [Candidatus Eremiobacteraeota bacterium]|nr:quinone oxidoreductase [Candidatus Eremiobacteraeota bacterium]MBC5828363.1 quinone oxidoreductase [Candidatus Eremiobacteraeota bacterium]
MKAIVAMRAGGPDVMQLAECARPAVGSGQALVRIHYAGINYVDLYYRSGVYPTESVPIPLGSEAAGTVEETGEGVFEVKPGDRVAYATHIGSYAEYAAVPADQLVQIPDGVDDRSAAGVLLQGMTAHYLTHSTYALQRGDVALIHAAAGGVGRLLVQMAKMRGASVIGTVSTEAKARAARGVGADYVINYAEIDFAAETWRLTDGRGAHVVYDSVGASTFDASLESLRARGTLVSFGNASGPVREFAPLLLSRKGSLYLTRPKLDDYVASREELLWRANDVFSWLAQGKLRVTVDREYELSDVSVAHRDLESRRIAGKLLLRLL